MIKFGTGGWRAIIGDEFCKSNVQLLCAAVARKLKNDGLAGQGFIIGYDRRFLSEEAVKWAGSMMAGEGVQCQIINRESPTPLIMYAVERSNVPYGMAITASHNPAIYNGIKLFMPGGRDADEVLTGEIEKYIHDLEGETLHPMDYEEALSTGMIELIDPMNEYLDSILGAVNTEAIRNRRLQVVLDPMYGVSKTAMLTLLYTLRCEVEIIHERRDTLFGGRMPAPNRETLATLMNFVAEHHSDIGIASDGDADRLGVVDDNGHFLHFNKVLVLLYYYLLHYKGWKGPVVRNIATTHLLDKVAADFGQVCYEVPVGFKHISSKMNETGAILGGESSGGLTVAGHIKGKDGIYSGTLLIEMLAVSGQKLSEIWQGIEQRYGKYEMAERDYHFSPAKRNDVYDRLMVKKELPQFPYAIEKVSYDDGCKVYFGDEGWIIARFSGTEPLLRIFCEMRDEKTASRIISIWEDALGI